MRGAFGDEETEKLGGAESRVVHAMDSAIVVYYIYIKKRKFCLYISVLLQYRQELLYKYL